MTSPTSGNNEVIVRSGRNIAMGDQWWEIRDSGEPIKFTDILTEARHVGGAVYLSFGACFIDANNQGMVDITSRIRLELGFAQALHSMLGQMISSALAPPDLSKAN